MVTSDNKTDFSSKSYPQQYVHEKYNDSRVWNNSSQIQIIPSLKLTYGDTLKPYVRLGIVLGVISRMQENFSTYQNYQSSWDSHPLPYMRDTSYTNTSETTTLYKSGLPVGITGAAGLDYKIQKNIIWYLEAVFVGMSWAPAYSEITKFVENGEDKLPALSKQQKQTKFVNSLESSNSYDYTLQLKKNFSL